MSRWIDLTEACYGGYFTSIPERKAVYVLKLARRRPLYIGSTTSISRRFRQHGIEFGGIFVYTPWGDFSECRIMARWCDDFRKREARLIRRLQPYANKTHPSIEVPV